MLKALSCNNVFMKGNITATYTHVTSGDYFLEYIDAYRRLIWVADFSNYIVYQMVHVLSPEPLNGYTPFNRSMYITWEIWCRIKNADLIPVEPL